VSLSPYLLTLGQKSTPLKDKLDSAMARLGRMCLQDDNDGLWNGNGNEQRAKLFEWVFEINYNLPRANFLLGL